MTDHDTSAHGVEDHYEPELGQAVFSNTPWGCYNTPGYVTAGLDLIGDRIANLRHGDPEAYESLTSNYGEPEYRNEVFVMRTYCWCDGEKEGHEEGCPPNFEHFASGFASTWYKHSHRSPSVIREISFKDWQAIQTECLESVPVDPCDHDKVRVPHPWYEDNPTFKGYWKCPKCDGTGFFE